MQKSLLARWSTVKAKCHKGILLCSVVYSFIWSIAKIVFGVFGGSYFFCISGISTLLIGFTKKVYLSHYQNEDFDTQKGKSIVLGILLSIIGVFFSIYMARLFIISTTTNYNQILSIAIAVCSFTELGISIYSYAKTRKTKDILHKSFRLCNIATSGFAITLTQVALLSASKTTSQFYNAVSGVCFGTIAIFIGIFIIINAYKTKTPTV